LQDAIADFVCWCRHGGVLLHLGLSGRDHRGLMARKQSRRKPERSVRVKRKTEAPPQVETVLAALRGRWRL
jgi:hypothetical protein